MKILVSNDDGINAPGIRALAERLAEESENEVYVVAPDRERSATGHSLTLHDPIRTSTVDYFKGIKAAWSTTGTPSDCVKLAVMELLPEPPDIVVAGINNGPNLGTDVLYSGTVAAAMEGAFCNVPGIAVSLEYGDSRPFDVAAEFVANLVRLFPKAHLAPRSLLNVNVPCVPSEEIAGVRITELGVRLYKDWFEKRTDPRGKEYYWLAGQAINEGEAENSDSWAVQNNYISLTPVSFNMLDRLTKEKLDSLPELTTMFSHKPKKR